MYYRECLKNACRIYTLPIIDRYLLSNSYGRCNGAEKALRHKELCQFYVAVNAGKLDEDVKVTDEVYKKVHVATQRLTDHLDEVIGFPLDRELTNDEWHRMAFLFFEEFHEIAMSIVWEY